MTQIPDDQYQHHLENITFNPIFILGLHRSGTSILYKILAETTHFNITTAYHILNFNEILTNHLNHQETQAKQQLNTYFKSQGISDRKIDKIKVTADYAHEYVYIFMKHHQPNQLTPQNQSLFEMLCKKIQFISENNKPILLKNPFDFPNFLTIKTLYPNAKFIFIHRHPYEVISSTLRAWQTLLATQNKYTALFSPHYKEIFDKPLLLWLLKKYYQFPFPPGLFEIIYRASKATNKYLTEITQLPTNDYISITYEQLCKNPNQIISDILKFLKQPSATLDANILIKPRKIKLAPEVQKIKKLIYKSMKHYFIKFNFDPNRQQ